MTESGPRKVIDDFLTSMPSMSEVGNGCLGSTCLANPNGFYHGGIPWIGHPTRMDINHNVAMIKVQCFSTMINDETPPTLILIGEDGLKLDDIEANHEIINDLTIATFIIDNPVDKLGRNRYYCANSKGGAESMNFLQVNHKSQIWTPWTPCQLVKM